MKRVLSIVALLATSSLLSGCLCWLCQEKITPAAKVLPGPPVMFSGQVISNFGEKVAGATVEVNGQMTQTDNNGAFRLPALLAWRYIVNIKKDGYGLFSGSFRNGMENITWTLTKATVWENQNPNGTIDVKDNLSIEGCQGSKRRPVNWTKSGMYEYRTRTPDLKKAFDAAARAASQPTECSLGIKLTIPPGSLEYKEGKSLSAQDRVTVSLATVDLFSPNGLPGDFVFVQRSEGQVARTGFMESFGAGSVTVAAGGQPLKLKGTSKATLVIPVDPNQKKRTSPPETIPLLVYDETRGLWVHEGTATLNAAKDAYVAEVSHFSEYNADVEFTTPACARMDTSAIGQTFDIRQHVFDQDNFDYHYKEHPGIMSGALHAFYALPPITATMNVNHKIVLEAYPQGACIPGGACSSPPFDIVTITNLPQQNPVPPIIPTPPSYPECQYPTVALYRDPTQLAKPTGVTATVTTQGAITVSWMYTWDPLIAVDNKDGFEVEEATCTMNNVVTTPTLRCGATDTSWGPWQTPQAAGVDVVRAKTANDVDPTTNRTTQMNTANFPRLPGLYKYRVRAYYNASALANPAAAYTPWSDDAVQPMTQPTYWASIGAGKLRIINTLAYVAPGTGAQYQDTWVSRLRISNDPQNMMSGQLLYGYTPERLHSDGYCGAYGDSLSDVPPTGAPSITSNTNTSMPPGWDEPNNLNGNITLPLSNYYLYIGLGHWYLWSGYGSSTMGTGVTCGNPTDFAKHLGGYNNFSIPYYHRSVGGIVPVLNPPSGTAASNYVAVQDHFTGTLTIVIGGTPNAPTVTALDQNSNQTTLNIVVGGSTDPVNSRTSP